MPFVFEQPNLDDAFREPSLFAIRGDGRLITVFTNGAREGGAQTGRRRSQVASAAWPSRCRRSHSSRRTSASMSA